MNPPSRSKAIYYGLSFRNTEVYSIAAYYLVDAREIKNAAKMLFF